MSNHIVVSNQLQLVTKIVKDDILLERDGHLFKLNVKGHIPLDSHNIHSILLSLTDRKLAHLLEAAFRAEAPTVEFLQKILTNLFVDHDMTIIFE